MSVDLEDELLILVEPLHPAPGPAEPLGLARGDVVNSEAQVAGKLLEGFVFGMLPANPDPQAGRVGSLRKEVAEGGDEVCSR